MEVVGKKWERMVQSCFEHFESEMSEHGHPVSDRYHLHYGPIWFRELHSAFGIKESEIKEVISFAVANWDKLREAGKIRNLPMEPNFKKITSKWSYSDFFDAMKAGEVVVSAKQAEEDKKASEFAEYCKGLGREDLLKND